jgi:peptidoglycan-associated lipoprotein
MKNTTRTALALAATLALLAGCETTPSTATTTAAPVEARNVGAGGAGAAGAGGATAGATPQSQVATVDLARSQAGVAGAALLAAPSQRIVYFDFDSFVIKDDYKALIEGHAKALTGNQGRRMVVEGHTDERGGREYNLALGQKRAEAVLRTLTLLGVSDKQLEAVSFGEERPAASGSDESAWARNRRAELKDR